MSNEKIQIDIGAKDDASPTIEKLARKIDGLEADEARIVVTADTRKLVDQLDRARIKLGTLTGDEATVQARLVGTLEADVAQAKDLLTQLDGQTATVKIDSVGAKQGIDEVGKSADSSKNVLANMVGNATQDVSGLGGALGVAAGQLTEFAADAKFSGESVKSISTNMLAVAGPIAAITAGMFLVQAALEAIAAPGKEAAERTKELGEAMKDTADDSVALAQVLRGDLPDLRDWAATANSNLGSFGLAVEEIGQKIPLIGSHFKITTEDVVSASRRAGLSIFGLGQQIAGTGKTTEDFEAQLLAAKNAGKITGDEMRAIEDVVKKYGDSAAQAAKDQGLFNVNVDEANAILQASKDPLEQFTGAFKVIKEDMADGAINTQAAAEWINILAANLGLTTDAVIALAAEDLKQDLDDSAAAADAAAEKSKDLADAYLEARDAAKELKDSNAALRDEIGKKQEWLDLQDAFDDVRVKGQAAFDAAATGADDAESKMREYERAQGDLTLKVLDYKTNIEEVPTDWETNVVASIERGELDVLEQSLGVLTSEKQFIDVEVRAQLATSFHNAMAAIQGSGARVLGTRATTGRLPPP